MLSEQYFAVVPSARHSCESCCCPLGLCCSFVLCHPGDSDDDVLVSTASGLRLFTNTRGECYSQCSGEGLCNPEASLTKVAQCDCLTGSVGAMLAQNL